uniref:Mitochondrial fission factor n=1 Tax=Haemonchus contortus TaxID=6289 RepID=A0A7I4Y5T5_HAECO
MSMIVPEHISVTGEPLKSLSFESQDVPQKERLMQMMNVPDRIVLKGGDTYEGFDAQPSELMDDHINHISKDQLQDLPHTITLAESPYLDRGGTTDEPVRSENSIAVEENPLQELKLMRRQIGRISSRLFQLEYELEQRRFRDKLSITALFGMAAVLLLALLRR